MTRKTVLVVELDQYELACRIAEGMMGRRRPKGMPPAQALAVMPPAELEGLLRAAMNAMEYLREQTEKPGAVQ
jgi:hypothetical protein